MHDCTREGVMSESNPYTVFLCICILLCSGQNSEGLDFSGFYKHKFSGSVRMDHLRGRYPPDHLVIGVVMGADAATTSADWTKVTSTAF